MTGAGERDALDALRAAGRRVIARGLTWGTSGNISARLGAERFAISASGAALDELDEERVATCVIAGDEWLGARGPSVETGMHRSIYAARPDVGAIVHASPPHATLVACSALAVDARVMSDTVHYVRRVARVPFHNPGSPELAEAATAAAADCDVLLLDNHGCLCLGATPGEAVTRLEALELLCWMLVAERLGFPLRPLTEAQAAGFLGAAKV